MYVAPEIASEPESEPVVTDTDGETAAPYEIDGLEAVTVIARVVIVIVCAALVADR